MKLLLILFLGTTLAVRADEMPPAQVNIRVDGLCLTLPTELAVPIIQRYQNAKPEEQSKELAVVNDLILQDKAKVVGWPVFTTVSGQRANIEDITEIRYATEFEPGMSSLGNLAPSPLQVPDAPTGKTTEFAPTATSFETRNAGVTLELEPEITKDGEIRASFVFQHVRLKSVDRLATEHELLPEHKLERVVIEQPRFVSMKITNCILMKSGERYLVGVYNLPEEKSLELFILRLNFQKPAAPAK